MFLHAFSDELVKLAEPKASPGELRKRDIRSANFDYGVRSREAKIQAGAPSGLTGRARAEWENRESARLRGQKRPVPLPSSPKPKKKPFSGAAVGRTIGTAAGSMIGSASRAMNKAKYRRYAAGDRDYVEGTWKKQLGSAAGTAKAQSYFGGSTPKPPQGAGGGLRPQQYATVKPPAPPARSSKPSQWRATMKPPAPPTPPK